MRALIVGWLIFASACHGTVAPSATVQACGTDTECCELHHDCEVPL